MLDTIVCQWPFAISCCPFVYLACSNKTFVPREGFWPNTSLTANNNAAHMAIERMGTVDGLKKPSNFGLDVSLGSDQIKSRFVCL